MASVGIRLSLDMEWQEEVSPYAHLITSLCFREEVLRLLRFLAAACSSCAEIEIVGSIYCGFGAEAAPFTIWVVL